MNLKYIFSIFLLFLWTDDSSSLLAQSSTINPTDACINCDSEPKGTLDVRGSILSNRSQSVLSIPGAHGHTLNNENGDLRWVIRGLNNETGGNEGYDFNIMSRQDDSSPLLNTLTIKRHNGRVGIGTTNPLGPLHVLRDEEAGSTGIENANLAWFERDVDGTKLGLGIYGYPNTQAAATYIRGSTMLYSNSSAATLQIVSVHPNSQMRFHVGGWQTTASEKMRLTSTEVTINDNLIVNGQGEFQNKIIVQGADIAEKFNINTSNATPDMLVSIDPNHPGELTISQEAYDKKIVGVISGANCVQAGMMLAQAGTLADGDTPVAIAGRVYCFADASQEPIHVGDFLTSSSIAGYARKASDLDKARGAIVGKAMTGLEEGHGKVLILISLQ